MIYGYARCSMDELKQDIDRQRRELTEAGAAEIYWEYERSGNHSRPELAKLMAAVRPGDTIIATEVSRLTRSTKHLCELMDFIVEMKLKLVVGTFVIDCASDLSAMTEGVIKLMGVFSEMERKMTVERVKSGLRNARAKGVRLGRPKTRPENLPKKFRDAYALYKDGKICMADVARLCGVARSTVYRWKAAVEADM